MVHHQQVLVRQLSGQTCVLDFGSSNPNQPVTALHIKHRLYDITGLPCNQQRLVSCGRELCDSSLVSSSTSFVSLLLRLPGGKGGFGANLRNAAKKFNTKNFNAMRDLSGRRLRHVKQDRDLGDWAENHKPVDEQEYKKKFAYLKETGRELVTKQCYWGLDCKYRRKCRFAHPDDEEVQAQQEERTRREGRQQDGTIKLADSFGPRDVLPKRNNIIRSDETSAVKAGLARGMRERMQRKRQRKLDKRKQREMAAQPQPDVTFTDGDGDLVRFAIVGDSQELHEFVNGQLELQVEKLMFDHEEQVLIDAKGAMSIPGKDEQARVLAKLAELVQVANIESHGILDDGQEIEIELDVEDEDEAQEPSSKKAKIDDSTATTTTTTEQSSEPEPVKESEPVQEVVPEPEVVFDAIDLSGVASASELGVFGADHLKAELTRMGLKCGGSLQMRCDRLFLLKSTPLSEMPRKHLAKKTQQQQQQSKST